MVKQQVIDQRQKKKKPLNAHWKSKKKKIVIK